MTGKQAAFQKRIGRRPAQYFTVGRVTKPFRRRLRKVRSSGYERYGAIRHVEKGGTTSNADCIYIGHGVAIDEAVLIFCEGLIRKLAMKAGYNLVSMDEKIAGNTVTSVVSPGSLEYEYSTSVNGAPTTAVISITADSTWAGVASQLEASLYSTVAEATDEFVIQRIRLVSATAAGS